MNNKPLRKVQISSYLIRDVIKFIDIAVPLNGSFPGAYI